jgi:mycothiol system anti-sigma-R factor
MTEHDHNLNPDCREVLSRLYEYLDGELHGADREEVRAHLEACRPCLNRFEFERLFHEYVQARVPRPQAREEFKAGLLARIRAESRSFQNDRSDGAPRLMPRFALAASLILLIGAGSWWMTRHGTPQAADWQLLADYHYHRASVPDDGIETNCPFKSRDFIVSRLGEETGRVIPTVVPAGMTVHEACVKPFKSGQLAFLEWRAQQEDVSVIVARASCLPLGGTPTMEWHGRPYHVVSKDGLNAVCWEEDGGYVCVMMAPADFGTVFTWVEQVRGPGDF